MITTILVGYFDDPREACFAREELIDTGIDPHSVELMSQPAHGRRLKHDVPDGDSGRDVSPEHHRASITSDGAIMTVSVTDDSRIEEITDILEIHGSSDTEQYPPEQHINRDTGSNPETAPLLEDQGQGYVQVRLAGAGE